MGWMQSDEDMEVRESVAYIWLNYFLPSDKTLCLRFQFIMKSLWHERICF